LPLWGFFGDARRSFITINDAHPQG